MSRSQNRCCRSIRRSCSAVDLDEGNELHDCLSFALQVKSLSRTLFPTPPHLPGAHTMHAAALLTAMVTHGLIMPPVERYKMGEQLRADFPWTVISSLTRANRGIISQRGLGNFDNPEKGNKRPWSDGEVFKSLLPEKFGWSEMSFSVPPNATALKLDIINCGTDERAKEIFLQLRLRRIPDYARSGKFLIKADEETFKWFLQNFGAERYSVRRPFRLWGYWITN
jgi:hypothetical protein